MKVLGDGEQPRPGHQFIHTHIVFDIKMDFTKRARCLATSEITQTHYQGHLHGNLET